MYFVIDVKGWWGGQPFIYPGTVGPQIRGSMHHTGLFCFGYKETPSETKGTDWQSYMDMVNIEFDARLLLTSSPY